MMDGHYVLDENGNPLPEPNIRRWVNWFSRCNRSVALDKFGNATVSTVFLGLDHSFGYGTEPLLYETMIFDHEEFGGYQVRYTTREETLKGHAEAVELVRKEGVESGAYYKSRKNENSL